MELPPEKIQSKIFELEIGKSGYIATTACWADKNRKFFIDTSYFIRSEKTELFCLKVTRHKKGYIVHILENDFAWHLDHEGIRDPFVQYIQEVYAFEIPSKESITRDSLEDSLNEAIEQEDYEHAAEIRNIIKNLNPG